MAHPIDVIDQAVRFFISQWCRGLQPSLKLVTKANGAVRAFTGVISEQPEPLLNLRRNDSGINSRNKRRLKRRTIDQNKDRNLYVSSQSSQTSNLDILDNSVLDDVAPTSIEEDYECLPNDHQTTSTEAAVQAVVVSTDVACGNNSSSLAKNLSVATVQCTDIPPRRIYHPAIINASKAFYSKHPSELTHDEVQKFEFYLKWKCQNGEPVESDIVYLPSSMRNCLHCGQLT